MAVYEFECDDCGAKGYGKPVKKFLRAVSVFYPVGWNKVYRMNRYSDWVEHQVCPACDPVGKPPGYVFPRDKPDSTDEEGSDEPEDG